jgi:hypothetical protein
LPPLGCRRRVLGRQWLSAPDGYFVMLILANLCPVLGVLQTSPVCSRASRRSHRQSGACRAQGYCLALLEGRSAPRLPQRVQVKFGSMSDNLTKSALRSESRHPTTRRSDICAFTNTPDSLTVASATCCRYRLTISSFDAPVIRPDVASIAASIFSLIINATSFALSRSPDINFVIRIAITILDSTASIIKEVNMIAFHEKRFWDPGVAARKGPRQFSRLAYRLLNGCLECSNPSLCCWAGLPAYGFGLLRYPVRF